MHGEHVAYGLLVQLALEGTANDELRDLAGFLRSVSLPTTLAEMGLDAPTSEDLDTMTDRCLASPHRHKTPAVADHASVRAAIDVVERLT
jgi:glycerol dehydrogenase